VQRTRGKHFRQKRRQRPRSGNGAGPWLERLRRRRGGKGWLVPARRPVCRAARLTLPPSLLRTRLYGLRSTTATRLDSFRDATHSQQRPFPSSFFPHCSKVRAACPLACRWYQRDSPCPVPFFRKAWHAACLPGPAQGKRPWGLVMSRGKSRIEMRSGRPSVSCRWLYLCLDMGVGAVHGDHSAPRPLLDWTYVLSPVRSIAG
jgi:hypothetical protein